MNLNPTSSSFMVLPGMRALTSDPNHPGEKRLRGFNWLPNRIRNLLIASIGEFVGTFLFLFFAYAGTQVANTAAVNTTNKDPDAPNIAVLLYISLAFGFSLLVNAWIFFRISGGLFNPAVTLGMCLIGAVGWTKGAMALVSQILGAIAAAAVVSALFPGPLAVRTTISPGTSVVRGLFIEMFLTAELVFSIFMLAAEKHKATFLAPIGIGMALFIAELAGVFFTGGSLNPARSFGPDVVLGHFDGYHWIYWVGPFLGAIVAVIFYRLIKVLEYETANPGQDFNDREAEHFDPDDEPASAKDVRRPTPGSGHGRHMDGANDTDRHTSHNGGHRSSNRNSQSSYRNKPEMSHAPHRHSLSHSRGRSNTDDRHADAMATAARAVYPPHGDDGNYSERQYGRSQPQPRSYAHGPHAESGSAGYSENDTTS